MKSNFIHLVISLCDALSFESAGHPFDGYFSPISDWIVGKKDLAKQIETSNDSSAETSNLFESWNIMDRELETRKKYLKKLYIPIVMETTRLAHRESSGETRSQLDPVVSINNEEIESKTTTTTTIP